MMLSKLKRNRKVAGGAFLIVVLTAIIGSSMHHSQPSVESAKKYSSHTVTATIFYIGENASKENNFITNTSTEWEDDAAKQLGGIDDPNKRDSQGMPAGFKVKENPFYFALPASEFNSNGAIPGAREQSPWFAQAKKLSDEQSLFKGRWIKVENSKGQVAYGQWLDTGPTPDPSLSRDYGYVFGIQNPKNQFGLKAGLDLSPSMAHQLGFNIDKGGITVKWQFVDSDSVPNGPWKKYKAINNRTYWK